MNQVLALAVLVPTIGRWWLRWPNLLGALLLPIIFVVIADRQLRRRR